MSDHLTYDAEARCIHDENGLTVARFVLPEDGPRLAAAYNLVERIRPALSYLGGNADAVESDHPADMAAVALAEFDALTEET